MILKTCNNHFKIWILLNEIGQQVEDGYRVTNSALHQYGLYIIAIIMSCMIIYIILKKITLFYITEEHTIPLKIWIGAFRAHNNIF